MEEKRRGNWKKVKKGLRTPELLSLVQGIICTFFGGNWEILVKHSGTDSDSVSVSRKKALTHTLFL
jgi:hypothetical protein